MSLFKKSIFIYRRDLRTIDNTALNECSAHSAEVLPVFIFDPRQIEPHSYRSESGLNFMLGALLDLEESIARMNGKIHFYYGPPELILPEIIRTFDAEAVFCNKDYTPFSIARDRTLEKCCSEHGVRFVSFHDAMLNDPGSVVKPDGSPYQVFTPFYKAAMKSSVRKASNFEVKNFSKVPNSSKYAVALVDRFSPKSVNARISAKKLLSSIKSYSQYYEVRDFPSLDRTTRLSVHNKFGTVSIREVFHACKEVLGVEHTLIKELYWRDFFTHIAFHFPHVFHGAFHRRYDKIEWKNNVPQYEQWCKGMTGFPIVDAGMRELNQTGFMHNRVRMIVASFLVKDLQIDWRWGERYFAQKLADYDPAVNNGNWQWAASTGCDAQPYFRIFNPWIQQEKFDSDCVYIKRWISELSSVGSKEIHALKEGGGLPLFGYPAPIVDHSAAKVETEKMFAKVVG